MSEIIVLGAGIVGISAALELQSRGHDVAVIDRLGPGEATSYGNAGIIMADMVEPFAMPRNPAVLLRYGLGMSNDLMWSARGLLEFAPMLARYFHHSAPTRHARLSQLNAQLVRCATEDHARLIEASGSGNLISQDGFFEIFRDERMFDKATRESERLKSHYGVRARILGGADYAAEEPAIISAPKGAVHWLQCWSCVDPGGLTKAYADLLVRRGASIMSGEARTLRQERSSWIVATDFGTISAQHVVIALGPWSAQYLASYNYRIGMIPKRGYHAHFSAPIRPKRPYLDTDYGVLVASMKKGLRLSSGVALVPQDAEPDAVQLQRGIEGVAEMIELGERVSEPLWFGARPCMPDMLPMVGAAPRHRNMWFNFGHGHQGLTLGPTTARLLADAIDGLRSPLLDDLSPAGRLS